MRYLLPILLLVLIDVAACKSQEGQVSRTPAPGPAREIPAEASWQQNWEKAQAAARNEGRLVIYSTQLTESRTLIGKQLKEKYGLDIEWMTGRGEEMTFKIGMERRAGLYFPDLMIAGVTTLNELSEQGALDALEPALILPEAKDVKNWLGGSLYFIDKDRKIFPFFSRTGSTIMTNTDMLKPEDLKSYRDLLKPALKGRIVMNDPTISGSGGIFAAVLHVLMGESFLRELARQEPIITRDQRQQVEWVARGKYPVLLGPHIDTMEEFMKAGAPVKHVIPAEGSWSGAGGGMIGLINRAAHPAAATVFLNWFLSREGQTVAVQAAFEQSRRLDVTTEFINPGRRLQPGVKYLDGDSDMMIQQRVTSRTLAKEVFAPLLK